MSAFSPCIDVCQMDPDDALCRGCLRTLEEIARWSRMSDTEKMEIRALLRERRAQQELKSNE